MLERIKQFINHKGMPVRKFEMALGMSNGTIHNAYVKNSSIGSQWLAKMALVFPELNTNWLITGKGTMLNSQKPSKNKKPYYNVDFSGGFMEQFNDQTQNPTDYITDASMTDVQFWCNLKGHSMEPTICDGERIALKVADMNEPIKWGSVYAVVTTDGLRTVKRLEKTDSEDCIRLVADNQEFASQDVATNTITHLFKVVAHMGLL